MAFRDKQKVVYTSPLKALSNQKYRELAEEFGDVGLMTGDTSISPNASCVVMTTEILRSMAYRGSEMLAQVGWLIFDEVHYMTDRERGVVWEECIMLTPPGARCVFLSATLPNSLQFAQWVARLHRQPCHVVYTDTRPTPLQHLCYPTGGSSRGAKRDAGGQARAGLHLVVDEHRRFREDNFGRMQAFFEGQRLASAGPASKGGGPASKGNRAADVLGPLAMVDDVVKVVRCCKANNMIPAIVFSFSRKDCEVYAKKSSVSDLDFTTPEEKEAIQAVFDNAIALLSEEDRQLPPVTSVLPMLRAGIGVHHSGLLPVVKELVELLFQEQLLKVLFATETFAIGLNMPARTVVFTQLRKFDGEETRVVSPGEYTQMSGRAGRRGKDAKGYVIVMADKDLDAETARQLMLGSTAPLKSSFKLSFYTLLNVMRRAAGEVDMEAIIAKSFHQFQHEQALPEHAKRVAALEAQAEAIQVAGADSLAEYTRLKAELDRLGAVILAEVLRPQRCLHFLRPGRIIRVRVSGVDFGWGVTCAVTRKGAADKPGAAAAPPGAASQYVVDTLLRLLPPSGPGKAPQAVVGDDTGGELHVIPVALTCVSSISALLVQLPADLRPASARQAVGQGLADLKRRFPGGLPKLDPVADMHIDEPEFKHAVHKVEELEPQLLAHPLFSPNAEAQRYGSAEDEAGRAEQRSKLQHKAALQSEAAALRAAMLDSEVVRFRRELGSRSQVLRRLGHIDTQGVVQLKGRAACGIDTADELVATELMFNGVFGALSPPVVAALCSCFIPTEKSSVEAPLQGDLRTAVAQLLETARTVGEVQHEAGMEVDVDAYCEGFCDTLCDPVLKWCTGTPFGQLLANTDLFEGTLIRAVRRLDELLMQLSAAAAAVGDVKLRDKFNAAAESLRHGIMFAGSLYL